MGGRNLAGGSWPWGCRGLVLQNAACSGMCGLPVGSETGGGVFFVVPGEVPLPSKRQPLVLPSRNKRPSPGAQLGVLL